MPEEPLGTTEAAAGSEAAAAGVDLSHISPESLSARYPGILENAYVYRGDVVGVVPAGSIQELCLALRDDPDWQMNFLADLTCADHFPQEPRFHIIYQLRSIPAGRHLTLKVQLPSDSPEVPSVVSVWGTANWLEREVYDLFGITFTGHPDLRRIMMPDGWEGHPLRRNYGVGKVRIPF